MGSRNIQKKKHTKKKESEKHRNRKTAQAKLKRKKVKRFKKMIFKLFQRTKHLINKKKINDQLHQRQYLAFQ